MKTLIKIAWRNVWRNKLRSGLVILSIVLGIWAGLFIMALTLGLNEQRMSGAIDTYLSHVQIHDSSFSKENDIKLTIKNKGDLLKKLELNKDIKSFAERTVVTGMVNNAKGSKGIILMGIHPKKERTITRISEKMVEGTYFSKYKKNPVVVGEKLAKKLHLKIKSKIVVSFLNMKGELTSSMFRVEGIYKTQNSIFDASTVFVLNSDLDRAVGTNGQIHEIAILGKSMDDVDAIKAGLANKNSSNAVESWAQIAPELGYAQKVMGSMIYIFMGIVLIALAFSIINTMLMAVLERKKELGMLMAVGLNKIRLFSMISIETIFIAIIATPIGMALSFFTIEYFGTHGIDLSAVASGLESLGIGAIIYTYLPSNYYIEITALTLLVAFIASIIPARKALKLRPSESIRD